MFSSQPPTASCNLNVALNGNVDALTANDNDCVRQHQTQQPSDNSHHQNHHNHLAQLNHNVTTNNFSTNTFHQPPDTFTSNMTNQQQAHHRTLAHSNQQTTQNMTTTTITTNNNNNSQLQHQNQLGQMASLQATHFDQVQQQQHQMQPQHITCMNVMNPDNLTNQLAAAGHVIFNQSGLIRLGQHAGVLNTSTSQAAIVVNTITSELRQQQHQSIPTFAICDNQTGANQMSAYSNNCQQNATNISSSSSGSSSSSRLTTANSITGKSSFSTTSSEICSSRAPNSSADSQSAQASQSGKNGCGGNRKKSRRSELNRTSQANDCESPRRFYACPTCDKDFTEKFNMKRHMLVHSPSRPKYICNECSKSFSWKDNFSRHKKAVHNNQARAIQTFPSHQ